ncbi:stage II sporulation protein R [Desulfofundulus thermosubterraneus]|uniref:Stage II sporulation protein R n=1 Tax=Desulfofundulus thermosubterraneus DSM 16057 TaxID=1121432 RepID=A0A1M6CE65_9FIRM|nr:stage II sporulation protein R [Desulfofundulus thermosubterraneus]SHI59319.1 stage II sporulation protein R [Desulfofundulus thermosubterraneus DSM 16057]
MLSQRRIGFWVAGVLVVTLLASWGWYRHVMDNPYRPDHLIRFHVIANSNSPADQALKFRVRDVLVQSMTPRFQQARDIEEARIIARTYLDYMEQLARQAIRDAGADYPVTVSLGHYRFPAKTYHVANANPGRVHDLTLPAGEYEAVRVVIGRGAGANWWCVLFPPLCFVDVQNAAGPCTGERENPPRRDSGLKHDPAKEGAEQKPSSPSDEGAAAGVKAEPAFKWTGPPAVATLAPTHRNGQGEGTILRANSSDGTPVEFRFRILDLFAGAQGWFNRLWSARHSPFSGNYAGD